MRFQTDTYPANADEKLAIAAETLYNVNYSDELEGCLPSAEQSVVRIHELIESAAHESGRPIIVFAMDAISLDYYRRNMSEFAPEEAQATPLTSVFPSTTASAWSSIITGTWPSEHGVYGTSFTHESTGQNYIWISNTMNHNGTRYTASKDLRLNLSDKPSIFQKLHEDGWSCFYNGNHGQGDQNPLRSELTRGADHFIPPDYSVLKYQPQDLLDTELARTSEILGSNTSRTLIWNYLDFDDFIHARGYDALTDEVNWQNFFDYWDQLVEKGARVLLCADHGQAEQQPSDLSWLKLTHKHPWFEADTGGAGRTLYFYPKPEYIADAKTWLEHNMGDSAFILSREEAFERGLFAGDISAATGVERLGKIIAIARNERFTSAGNTYKAEHGSITQSEMIVPLVTGGF